MGRRPTKAITSVVGTKVSSTLPSESYSRIALNRLSGIDRLKLRGQTDAMAGGRSATVPDLATLFPRLLLGHFQIWCSHPNRHVLDGVEHIEEGFPLMTRSRNTSKASRDSTVAQTTYPAANANSVLRSPQTQAPTTKVGNMR